MSIRKFRAARINTTTASTYVGQPGDMFYDEATGQLKISDGTTHGGHFVTLVVATASQVGGIKAGPGANIGTDGTLTVNVAGLPLSVGDLAITNANISTINANENLNLLSNGTGEVNIVGNLHVHTTAQGPDYATPILAADNKGNVTTNGNLITNGQVITNGNLITNGNTTRNGNTISNGNVTWNGTTITNGPAINNGNTTFNGNLTITGNVVQTGNATFTGTTTITGPEFNIGNVNVTGNLISQGGATVILAPNIGSGSPGALNIVGSSDGSYAAISGAGGMIHVTGNENTPTKVTVDSFGANAFASFVGRTARGTAATPTATQVGDVLLRVSALGWAEAGYNTSSTGGPPTSIDFVSTDNYTHSVYGSKIVFYTSPTGSIGRNLSLTVDPTGLTANAFTGNAITVTGNATAGNVSVTGNISANWAMINGFTIGANAIVSTNTATDINIGQLTATANININRTLVINKETYTNGNINVASGHSITTPRVVFNDGGIRQLTGNTAVTLDFTTDSLVSLTNPTGPVTITLVNYTAGAIIRFIYSAVTPHNIAMGVNGAVNSTTGGTTLTGTGGGPQFGGTQSVVLTYYCVGGTAATTYVAANYA